MWKTFKYNMRLVTFLLLIQMVHIMAKAIENPHTCNDSPENDPRLKRSDEKDIYFDSEENTGKDPDTVVTRKTLSKTNNENDNKHDITYNDTEISNEFASNSYTLPQKLPLVSNAVTKFPANVEKRDIDTDTLTTTKYAPLEQPVYYKAIDPKYLLISGMYLPKRTKNINNISKSEDPVNIELKETIKTPLDYLNLTKPMNVSNGDEANGTVSKEVVINDTDSDVTNIRKLRQHLLDHLLDYFLNIIKEENYIRNDTRKKNGEDRIKIEEKLRNYYDPHHLDILFVDDDDDDDYYDNNLDLSDYRRGIDSEEDLLDNVEQNEEVNKENITYIDLLNTQADEVDKNAAEAHTTPEDLQNEHLNLVQNFNSSSSTDGESLNGNLSEPSPSKYINLFENENDLNIVFVNTTEQSEYPFNTNANIITTTEISISNEALNDKSVEIDTDLLDYSEEVATDRIEYVYDNGALTVDDHTSYEDYIDSDEFEVAKNVIILHENDRNSIVITTENDIMKNELDKEKFNIANGTLNETYTKNSQIGNNRTTSKDIASEREHKPNKLAILDLPNKNIHDNSPCNEDNLAENKNKNSNQGIKTKLRNNNNCGKVVNKNNKLINKKSSKHNCRKSIILNLNINLI